MRLNNNSFAKLITSLPVILLASYFIPFLGICLLIFNCIINRNKIKICFELIICGIIIVIPKAAFSLCNLIKLDTKNIPYFNDIFNSNLYNTKFIKFSKFLIIIGVIFFIIMYFVQKVMATLPSKIEGEVRNYINRSEDNDAKIREKNNLIMEQKKEELRNTHMVRCPKCGSTNTIVGNAGKCKFCRNDISYNG